MRSSSLQAGLVAGLMLSLSPAPSALEIPQVMLEGHTTRPGASQQGKAMIGVILDGSVDAPTVVECVPWSPAVSAGLAVGDVILELGGRPTPDRAALVARLADLEPGQRVDLRVLREGLEREGLLILGDARDYEAASVTEALELEAASGGAVQLEGRPREVEMEVEVEFEAEADGGGGAWTFLGRGGGEPTRVDHGELLEELAAELAGTLADEIGPEFERLMAAELRQGGDGRGPAEVFRQVMVELGDEVEATLRDGLEAGLTSHGLLPHAAHRAIRIHGDEGDHGHGGAIFVPAPQGADAGGSPRHQRRMILRLDGEPGVDELHEVIEEAFEEAGLASGELEEVLRELEAEHGAEVEVRSRMRVGTVGPDGRVEVYELDDPEGPVITSGMPREVWVDEDGRAHGLEVRQEARIVTVGPDGRVEVHQLDAEGPGHAGEGAPHVWLGHSGGAPHEVEVEHHRGPHGEHEIEVHVERRVEGRGSGSHQGSGEAPPGDRPRRRGPPPGAP